MATRNDPIPRPENAALFRRYQVVGQALALYKRLAQAEGATPQDDDERGKADVAQRVTR